MVVQPDDELIGLCATAARSASLQQAVAHVWHCIPSITDPRSLYPVLSCLNEELLQAITGLANDSELPPKPSLFRYGAYVLPLFLETRFGASIVKGIWDKTTEYNQVLFAIDSAIGAAGSSFHKEWPKYNAANWNRNTIDTYFKADILAEAADLNGDATLNLSAGAASRGHPVDLKPAAAAYYRVRFGRRQA